MTLEEIRALDLDGIEARTAEIRTLMDAEDADIEALTSEVDALTQRKAEIAESNKNFAELRAKVAQTNNNIIEKQEETKMTLAEVRSMQSYIDAYANYIKTGKDTQCRAILTENSVTVSTAKVPVPTIVMDTIQHAWDKMTILSRTTQTDLKGNVKVSGAKNSALKLIAKLWICIITIFISICIVKFHNFIFSIIQKLIEANITKKTLQQKIDIAYLKLIEKVKLLTTKKKEGNENEM